MVGKVNVHIEFESDNGDTVETVNYSREVVSEKQIIQAANYALSKLLKNQNEVTEEDIEQLSKQVLKEIDKQTQQYLRAKGLK